MSKKGICLIKNVVYKVESMGTDKCCIGSTESCVKVGIQLLTHLCIISNKQNIFFSNYVWSYFHKYKRKAKNKVNYC